MKTRIYKPALIRNTWQNKGLECVKAKRVFLEAEPNRIFFAHKNSYGYFTITEAYSGAAVIKSFTKEKLDDLIEQANYKIKNQIPKQYKSFTDFVEDFVIRNGYLPFMTNLKTFSN